MVSHTEGPWIVRWNSGGITDPELLQMLKEQGKEPPTPVETLTNEGQRVVMSADGEVRIAVVDLQTEAKRGQRHLTACPERDANARLVACAPELLELAKIVAVASQPSDIPGINATARALIEKVEGR